MKKKTFIDVVIFYRRSANQHIYEKFAISVMTTHTTRFMRDFLEHEKAFFFLSSANSNVFQRNSSDESIFNSV